MLLLLPIFCVFALGSAQQVDNPKKLGCERIYGDFNGLRTVFARPMEIGDRLLINGTVWPSPQTVRINIHDLTPPLYGFPLHMKNVMNRLSYTIYTAWVNGGWTSPQEHGPQAYRAGEQYLITIEYTGAYFNIFSGPSLIWQFKIRTPAPYILGATDLYGTHTTNWMEMQCKNPPVTIPPPTTRRSGGSNGHGGHGHGGHGHGYDSGSYSGSFSSEEC